VAASVLAGAALTVATLLRRRRRLAHAEMSTAMTR